MSCVLFNRIFQLQIVEGADKQAEFEMKIKKERSIASTRGNIFDVNGIPLAYNELSSSVTIEDVYESKGKNAKINGILKEVLGILWENGDTISCDFNIYIDENGEFAYSVTGTRRLRFIADVYGEPKISDLELLPGSGFSAAPKHQSRQKGGEHMDQPQPHPGPHTAEHPHAQHTDEEHRIGVVAEGQQPLRLLPGDQIFPVEVCCRLGADGVAPHQPQHQRSTASTGTRNSGSISPASQGAASSPNPRASSAEEATRKGNSEGTTERAQRAKASATLSRTAPASARNHTSRPPRHRQASIRHRIRIPHHLSTPYAGAGDTMPPACCGTFVHTVGKR